MQSVSLWLIVVVLLEVGGLLLFLNNYDWGLIMSVSVAAVVQAMTLVFVWYMFKMVYQMKQGMEEKAPESGDESSD